MSIYLTRAQYSATAFKGMLSNPSDRGAAARTLFDAMGLKTHSIHFSVTTGEIVVMVEGTAEQLTAVEMVVMGSGAFSNISSIEVVTVEQMNASMSQASQIAAKYQPPNK